MSLSSINSKNYLLGEVLVLAKTMVIAIAVVYY